MRVDVRLSNATLYDVVERFDIVKGQSFSLSLVDYAQQTRWLFEHDEVLSVKVEDTLATVTASELGESTLFIVEKLPDLKSLTVVKAIIIKVVSEIVFPAVALNAEVGEEQPK